MCPTPANLSWDGTGKKKKEEKKDVMGNLARGKRNWVVHCFHTNGSGSSRTRNVKREKNTSDPSEEGGGKKKKKKSLRTIRGHEERNEGQINPREGGSSSRQLPESPWNSGEIKETHGKKQERSKRSRKTTTPQRGKKNTITTEQRRREGNINRKGKLEIPIEGRFLIKRVRTKLSSQPNRGASGAREKRGTETKWAAVTKEEI